MKQLSLLHELKKKLFFYFCCSQPGAWQTKLSQVCNVIDFDRFISRGSETFQWPQLDERSAVNVGFTSGTTGAPKGVVYSHRSTAIHVMAYLMTDFLAIKGTDCWLPLAPMFHAGAWNIPYLSLCLGNKVVLSNTFSDAETHMNMIAVHGVTIFSGVPTVMQSLRMEYQSNPSKYSKIKGIHLCVCPLYTCHSVCCVCVMI